MNPCLARALPPGHGPRRIWWCFLFSLVCMTSACFRHIERERQLGNSAYLAFPRLQSEVHVKLVGPRFYEFDASGGKARSFEIEAGRYTVVLTRGTVTVAQHDIYVSAGQTKEMDTQ